MVTTKYKEPAGVYAELTLEELCGKLIDVNIEIENLTLNLTIRQTRKKIIEKRIKELMRPTPKPVYENSSQDVPW